MYTSHAAWRLALESQEGDISLHTKDFIFPFKLIFK